MRHFTRNATWLLWLAPFRALSVSAAFLTPFFIEKGLEQTEIFFLQSFFSVVVVLLEVPSGWIADKYGRARCIRWSAPLAGSAMIAYGFGSDLWFFLICEFALAAANGLISGADNALLMDSLKAEGRESEYVQLARRIDALGFASVAFSVPIAFLVVDAFGVPATLVVDGCLTLFGASVFSYLLVEAPSWQKRQGAFTRRALTDEFRSDMRAAAVLITQKDTRDIALLHMSFNACTYFGFWLSAPYYTAAGIPVRYFALLLAARSLFKFVLSHRFRASRVSHRAYWVFVFLSGGTYLGMASVNAWFLPVVIGHDIVQSLAFAPLRAKLNDYFPDELRATMDSAVNMLRRLCFATIGLVIGPLVDHAGLRFTLIIVGLVPLAVLPPLVRNLIRIGRV